MSTDTTTGRLAEVEREIAAHEAAIVTLRGEGAWLLPTKTSGQQALQWLTSRGATDAEARSLLVEVIKERRQQRQDVSS